MFIHSTNTVQWSRHQARGTLVTMADTEPDSSTEILGRQADSPQAWDRLERSSGSGEEGSRPTLGAREDCMEEAASRLNYERRLRRG